MARESLSRTQAQIDATPFHVNGKAAAQAAATRPVVLRHVADIVAEQREPDWLIHKVLERNVLAILAGKRGTFKSLVALHWAMLMALDGHAGVILSGEGKGLDRRIDAWMRQHRDSTDLHEVPLVALERPLNLTAIAELDALQQACRALTDPPTFIVIDTLSKFSAGLDENDNSEVANFLSGLSAFLREDLACTVLLVAHAGHGDGKRPRGASALMANPDCEYIVERADPGAMTVTVSRERFKDAPAMPPLAYEARVVDLGRIDRHGDPVTSLAFIEADAPVASNAKGRGRNQERVLIALKEWHRAHPDSAHIATMDMREICRAQKIDRKRQGEVLDSFVNSRILSPSVGGYTLHGENL